MTAPNIWRSTTQDEAAASVLAGRSHLYGYSFVNDNAYAVYVKLYDALVGNVVVGTTIPKRVIPVPPYGYMLSESRGYPTTRFDNGLAVAITKLRADSDATAIDTGVFVELFVV